MVCDVMLKWDMGCERIWGSFDRMVRFAWSVRILFMLGGVVGRIVMYVCLHYSMWRSTRGVSGVST